MAERPEDLNLPNAVITRIIKESLPEGVVIAKEARIAISKAASVFVLYATSCANNFALKSKRKTLTANDVLEAMEEMEFEKFLEPLHESLQAYRSFQKDKKEAALEKRKQQENEEVKPGDENTESTDNVNDEDEGIDEEVNETVESNNVSGDAEKHEENDSNVDNNSDQ